ncbi:hypothetical protein D1159_14145 [Pseudoflavonifractor sp. 524-17]|uniref:SpoVG family protein n=1 Tax=Pseudoflavonifractor sp. 524-17 TaxID=2304577 RepID=UPI00137B4C3A|nr:SpoVG family protein [Pseudoflavonifractor sp. 524-17]NCE65685.1 hypothetical protein [Pseudoflavonifractor sp. 524-17]
MEEHKASGAPGAAIPSVSVKIYPVERKAGSKLLAFASASLGGVFAVNNIRIYDTEKGPFAAMPSSKGKDGNYHDICCPTTKEMREALHGAVLGAYHKAMEQERPSVRGAIKDAAKEPAERPAQAHKAEKGAR